MSSAMDIDEELNYEALYLIQLEFNKKLAEELESVKKKYEETLAELSEAYESMAELSEELMQKEITKANPSEKNMVQMKLC